MTGEDTSSEALGRRSVLRAGAIGAAWAVPTVAVLGVGAAHADTPSGPPPTTTPPPSGTTTTTTTTTAAAPSTRSAGGDVHDEAEQDTDASALAFTGNEAGPVVALGAGLALGGAALKIASRRRAEPGKHEA